HNDPEIGRGLRVHKRGVRRAAGVPVLVGGAAGDCAHGQRDHGPYLCRVHCEAGLAALRSALRGHKAYRHTNH
ncbi:hypothetical protein LSTR_LSTR012184, partial [Laodelphax striatellus]